MARAMAATRRVAIVTGGGSGLGRLVACLLHADGWSVAVAGRRSEALDGTVARCDDSSRALAVPTDVRDPDAVRRLFDAVRRRFGRLDFLLNNAGAFGSETPTEDVAYEEWREVLDVNVTGAFLCAAAAFRQMQAQRPRGGRIVNVGSIAAHSPRPHSVAYTASKHALTGLTRSLALDGRRHGIACGQIDLGNAATERVAASSAVALQAHGALAEEPRMGPEHAARTVLMMADLPLDANVQFVTMLPPGMPYVGRG
jgi:NAD(P)-dependent dehydrogenase (short-subunit alcohol dehydrogenase family)